MRLALLSTIAFSVAQIAYAEAPILKTYDGTFDDATFAVETAIVGKGLVIDYVSHTGLAHVFAVHVCSGAPMFVWGCPTTGAAVPWHRASNYLATQ